MTQHHIAYLAQGKLHLRGDGASQTVESSFGRSLRERALQIHQRHAWKTQGRSAQFMTGMLWPSQGSDATEFRIAITSVTRGRKPGELLYSLETDEISGVFAVDAEGVEQRLFHTADFRVRHVALHPDGETIALSVFHNSIANVAMLNVEGTNFTEISEGDSLDLAPRWVPGPRRRLVYQSAGVGRDGRGRFFELAPFAVQQLDLESGEIECLAEDAEADLVAPQMSADGTLYYVRRPREKERTATRPIHALTDVLLFPFRMSYAIFQFFNFFSMRYTGKPLSTSRGAAQRQPDLKQMMFWSNLTGAAQAPRGDGEPEAPTMVPGSWQLIRKTAEGTKVIAKHVLSFDLARDGSVLYSNGEAILRAEPESDRTEKILAGNMIDQVTAL